MRSRDRRSLAALIFAACAAAVALPRPVSALSERVERFQGTARDTYGEVLYVEWHDVRSRGERLLSAITTYRDAAGEVIAVLTTDFSRDPFAPSYRFEDRRFAVIEEVQVLDGALTLGAGGRRRTLSLPTDPARPLVAGQGLDRYVRDQLPALAGGAELQVAFAIPSRRDAYDFRLRAVRADASKVRVRVEIDSWVLRIFASSLDVEYDRETRRLLRYRGPSNLVDEDGEHPEVEITYAYPDAR